MTRTNNLLALNMIPPHEEAAPYNRGAASRFGVTFFKTQPANGSTFPQPAVPSTPGTKDLLGMLCTLLPGRSHRLLFPYTATLEPGVALLAVLLVNRNLCNL